MNMKSNQGFTLIELLVVIAVIGILLAVLLPSVTKGLEMAQRARGAHNMRMLTLAWNNYALDNGGRLIGAEPSDGGWVGTGDTLDAIRNGALYPFLENVDVYNDPTSILPYYSSFAINRCLNGVAASGGGSTLQGAGIGARNLEDIEDPSGTFCFIPDYDIRGYLQDSFVIDPAAWNWVDRVCGNYSSGDNISFVDGHVEFRIWRDPDTLREHPGNHNLRDPDSEDMIWLGSRYYAGDVWP